MRYRSLGKSGIVVSRLGFGCGDNAGLLTGEDQQAQRRIIDHAIERGVTFFDTAAKYGGGRSEVNLGQALRGRADVVVSTKLSAGPGVDLRTEMESSLARLGRERVDLVQLHNRLVWDPERYVGITGGVPPVSWAEFAAPGGVGDQLAVLKGDGLVGAVGIGSFGGDPGAVKEVLASGVVDTLTVSAHLLNPTALEPPDADFVGVDYERIGWVAYELGLGVLLIRALAGGRLAGPGVRPPDQRAGRDYDLPTSPRPYERVAASVDAAGRPVADAAFDAAFSFAQVASCIGGFAAMEHLEAALAAEARNSNQGMDQPR